MRLTPDDLQRLNEEHELIGELLPAIAEAEHKATLKWVVEDLEKLVPIYPSSGKILPEIIAKYSKMLEGK